MMQSRRPPRRGTHAQRQFDRRRSAAGERRADRVAGGHEAFCQRLPKFVKERTVIAVNAGLIDPS
jgi:hypothetical protein